jgi:hypothetical protein
MFCCTMASMPKGRPIFLRRPSLPAVTAMRRNGKPLGGEEVHKEGLCDHCPLLWISTIVKAALHWDFGDSGSYSCREWCTWKQPRTCTIGTFKRQ